MMKTLTKPLENVRSYLSLLCFILVVGQASAQITYPDNAVFNVLDYAPDGVTINDGVTDATPYIQAAFEDLDADEALFGAPLGWSYSLYFPSGTYLIKESVYIDSYINGGTGRTITLLGAGTEYTTIKLADNSSSFQDASNPIPVVSNAGNESTKEGFTNVAFMNNIMDMTIDVGSGNPGAMGVRYIANNQGTMCNVNIKGDGSAYAGIDMERASIAGPALIKNVIVDGFQFGVRIAGPNYSMTMENLTLQNIGQVGLWNNQNVVSVRNLETSNIGGASVANVHIDGMITLTDAQLSGNGTNAIENDGYMFLRNIEVNGRAVKFFIYM